MDVVSEETVDEGGLGFIVVSERGSALCGKQQSEVNNKREFSGSGRSDSRSSIGELPTELVGPVHRIPDFCGDGVHAATIQLQDPLPCFLGQLQGPDVGPGQCEQTVDDQEAEVYLDLGHRLWQRGGGIDVHGLGRTGKPRKERLPGGTVYNRH